MPLIQVTSGGQRSLLKKKLQVCESQQSCLFVGDQILIFHHNLQIKSLKILQCDFLDFFFLFCLIVEVYLWWKLQVSLIFLSGRTCTIGGWLNTFLPHCIYIYIYTYIGNLSNLVVWDCLKTQFLTILTIHITNSNLHFTFPSINLTILRSNLTFSSLNLTNPNIYLTILSLNLTIPSLYITILSLSHNSYFWVQKINPHFYLHCFLSMYI